MPDMSLSFDSGERTLELKDAKGINSVEVLFNPYDVMFLGKLVNAAEQIDAVQSELKSTPTDNFMKFYDASITADKKMRGILDCVFNVPVCEKLFPRQTVYAVGNGFPAWANLLYAVIDHMDAGLDEEKNRAQERIRKYSEKYKRK